MEQQKLGHVEAAYLAVRWLLPKVGIKGLDGVELAEKYENQLLCHKGYERAMRPLKQGNFPAHFEAFWYDSEGMEHNETSPDRVLICAMDCVAARFPQGFGYAEPQMWLRALRDLITLAEPYYTFARRRSLGENLYSTRSHKQPRISVEF